MTLPSALRRSLPALLYAGLLASTNGCASEPASTAGPSTKAPPPADRLDWWRDARLGMFIHWGLYSVPAGAWQGATGHAEWIRTTAHIPREQYEEFLGRFDPVDFDAEEWVLTAKRAGMKYIVITSKHHDGFCLFDSQETEWDVMSTPYGRDLLAQLADACRRHGLKMCWYHSIMDWHHPDYLPRRDWEDWSPEGADFDRYVAYLRAQVTELLTNYGDIGIMWFDGEWERTWNHEYGQALYDLCRELQPNVIVNNRVDVGRGGMAGMTTEGGYAGDYGTPEQEIPATGLPGVDWETCMTMNDHWGFNAADEQWKSSEELIEKLVDIASKGGNFLLNVGPTATGSFPAASVARLEAMGRWLDVNGEAIYGTQAGPFEGLPWGRATSRTEGGKTTLYLSIFTWPADGVLFVPGLGRLPVGARALSRPDGPGLAFSSADGGVRVTLDEGDRAATAPVIALEFDRPPVVFRTPRIEAAADVFVRPLSVTLDARSPGLELRYTRDGTVPTADSPRYREPLTLTETTSLRVRAFFEGRPVSAVVGREFTRATPAPAVTKTDDMHPGLHLAVFKGDYDELPPFDLLTPDHFATAPGFDLGPDVEYTARRYTGFVYVPADDAYAFRLTSDDGSCLYLDDALVVDNDGLHGPRTLVGVAALAAGWHPLRVEWFNKTGGAVLDLEVGPVGTPPEPLAPERLATR